MGQMSFLYFYVSKSLSLLLFWTIADLFNVAIDGRLHAVASYGQAKDGKIMDLGRLLQNRQLHDPPLDAS